MSSQESVDPDDHERLRRDVESLAEELRGEIDDVEAELQGHLEDVRRRVVQLKREKAPADHTHEEYADCEAFESAIEDLEELEALTEEGFDNFEEILEGVLARLDEHGERTTILARATVDLGEECTALTERERRRREVDALQLAANRLGIRKATCEDCASTVDVALLTEPECPHCASSLTDVQKKTSIFGSHTLVTGEPPALAGGVDDGTNVEFDGEFEWVDGSSR